jgi:type I restriction enzyme S subunit
MKKMWQTKKLREVCELVNGRAYSKPELLAAGKYRVLRVGNFFTNDHWYYSDMELEEKKYCHTGDLLYAWSASFGPRMWTGGKVIYHYHIWKVVHDSTQIDQKFLFYFFQWDTEKIKEDQGTGTTMMHVSMGSMNERDIHLPPLPEQQRIVRLLDEAFEGLATAKANAEKNLQNARALFESGLDSAITGKLTRGWRHTHKNIENASADLAGRLTVRRKQWKGTGKYREPNAAVTPKPIDIPEGWVLASPEQISTHIVDCPHSTPKWAESGVLCLRTTNFKPGLLDLESVRFVSPQTYKERIMRLEPQPGDVLYSREGGILGVACIIPAKLKICLGQRMMLFRTDAALVLPEYFTAVLNSTLILSEVKRLIGGAASPHLNICDIRTFPIPLPTINEQREIVAMLNIIAAETQSLGQIYERKLAALAELKKSLLHQAFTGEL